MNDESRLLALPELRKRGFQVLVEHLGAANALRFLHLYDVGHGDYTLDRDRWLGHVTIEQAEEEVRRMHARGEL